MKKRINIIIIGFSIFLISWHPYQPNLDKRDDNLKGPVKTVIEYIWNWGDKNTVVKEYNKQGKLIEIKFYGLSTFEDSVIYGSFPDSINSLLDTNKLQLLCTISYDYSNSGKLTTYKKYDVKKKKAVFFAHLHYNDRDSLIAMSEICFYENDSVGVDSTNIYYTNHDTSLVKTVINSSLDTVLIKTYVLNKQGQIESATTKDYNYSECLETDRYIYDEYGRIRLKIKSGKPKYDFIYCGSERHMITYDENNKIIKSEYIREGENDTIREELILEYDTLGNRIRELKFKYENNILDVFSKTLFNENNDYIDWYAVEYFINKNNVLDDSPTKENCVYSYDSMGNWINVKRYREGKHDSEDERIIKYYEK